MFGGGVTRLMCGIGVAVAVMGMSVSAQTIKLQVGDATATQGLYVHVDDSAGPGVKVAGSYNAGDYAQFDNVDFGAGAWATIDLRLSCPSNAAGNMLTFWIDDTTLGTGTIIATHTVLPTWPGPDWWIIYKVQQAAVVNSPTGVHKVFIMGTGENTGAGICNLDYVEFMAGVGTRQELASSGASSLMRLTQSLGSVAVALPADGSFEVTLTRVDGSAVSKATGRGTVALRNTGLSRGMYVVTAKEIRGSRSFSERFAVAK